MTFKAFAVKKACADLVEFEYLPIPLKDDEVEIDIECCGVCHSDLHQACDDWGSAHFPLVPGHEIVGYVVSKGKNVSCIDIGARVGVGPQTGSCKSCDVCLKGQAQHCASKIKSYNTPTGDKDQPFTYGGFSNRIRVNAEWAFSIPDALDSIACAPLLCAGVTTWMPFARHKLPKGSRVGIIGIGGLGHVALQFSHHLGYHTIAISSSSNKREEAKEFGATEFLDTSSSGVMDDFKGSLDFILCTVSASIDWSAYLRLLKAEGTFCLVGLPSEVKFTPGLVVTQSLNFCGSYLASPLEIKRMLEFCAIHSIKAKTESMQMNAFNVNLALKKIKDNSPRYRVVLVNPSQ